MDATPNDDLKHRDEEALWASGLESIKRRRAMRLQQAEIVAVLWSRTARDDDARRTLVNDLAASWKIAPDEARDLLRDAERLLREGFRDPAGAPGEQDPGQV
jgi:hypothetical protein